MEKLELEVNGQKMWMDFELWRLECEWLKKLQGLPNEYDKLYDKWQTTKEKSVKSVEKESI